MVISARSAAVRFSSLPIFHVLIMIAARPVITLSGVPAAAMHHFDLLTAQSLPDSALHDWSIVSALTAAEASEASQLYARNTCRGRMQIRQMQGQQARRPQRRRRAPWQAQRALLRLGPTVHTMARARHVRPQVPDKAVARSEELLYHITSLWGAA